MQHHTVTNLKVLYDILRLIVLVFEVFLGDLGLIYKTATKRNAILQTMRYISRTTRLRYSQFQGSH